MALSFEVYDTSGNQLTRWSQRLSRGRFSYNERGCMAASAFVAATQSESARMLAQVRGDRLVVIADAGGAVWSGRLSSLSLVRGGVEIHATGLWEMFGDLQAVFSASTTSYGDWQMLTAADDANVLSDLYEYDQKARLYIASRAGSYSNTRKAIYGLRIPHNSEREFVTLTIDYSINANATWKMRVESRAWDWTGASTLTTVAGSATPPVTGTYSTTLAPTSPALTVSFFYDTTATTLAAGPSLTITNVRIKTWSAATVSADLIAAHLLSGIGTSNPGLISTATGLIQAPSVDLTDYSAVDIPYHDVMTQVAPADWVYGVNEARLMYLYPAGTYGRTWEVDAESLDGLSIELTQVVNSVRAVYQGLDGETRRTSASQNAISQQVYGIVRQARARADTTSSTQADTVAADVLDASDYPTPVVTLTPRDIFSTAQGRLPRYKWHSVRPGDYIIIRNLPPAYSNDVALASVYVRQVEFDMDTGKPRITATVPPSLLWPKGYRQPAQLQATRMERRRTQVYK